MVKQSLGLFEIQGLAAAIEAADAAVKSADVKLVGYELARGDGWTTVKVTGDVSAVKAAIAAAKTTASKAGAVVSTDVIARPASSTESMVVNRRTLGSMPGARAEVKGNSPLSASFVSTVAPSALATKSGTSIVEKTGSAPGAEKKVDSAAHLGSNPILKADSEQTDKPPKPPTQRMSDGVHEHSSRGGKNTKGPHGPKKS